MSIAPTSPPARPIAEMTSPIIPTLLSIRTRIVMLLDALGAFLTSLRASVWLGPLSFCISNDASFKFITWALQRRLRGRLLLKQPLDQFTLSNQIRTDVHIMSINCESANVCRFILKKTSPVTGPKPALAPRRLLRLIEPDLFQDVLNSGEMVIENFARYVEKP